MSNSSLVTYTKLSPNYSVRTAPISKITIHHCAVVNATLQGLGNTFAQPTRQASSTYGIDSNGNVGQFVDEKYRPWTSSSRENDNVAVTIEVSNSKGAPNWEVSDKALAATIELCADICKRNGIKALNYTGNKSGNLTLHKWFAATNCPGAYLESKMPYIAAEVNKRLGNTEVVVKDETKVNIELTQLAKGATGAEVKTLQRLLLALGYKMTNANRIYGVDGSFGQATKNAVINFQRAKGLAKDGIVGKETWTALLKE